MLLRESSRKGGKSFWEKKKGGRGGRGLGSEWSSRSVFQCLSEYLKKKEGGEFVSQFICQWCFFCVKERSERDCG